LRLPAIIGPPGPGGLPPTAAPEDEPLSRDRVRLVEDRQRLSPLSADSRVGASILRTLLRKAELAAEDSSPRADSQTLVDEQGNTGDVDEAQAPTDAAEDPTGVEIPKAAFFAQAIKAIDQALRRVRRRLSDGEEAWADADATQAAAARVAVPVHLSRRATRAESEPVAGMGNRRGPVRRGKPGVAGRLPPVADHAPRRSRASFGVALLLALLAAGVALLNWLDTGTEGVRADQDQQHRQGRHIT
jgi:hypothetical protein